MVNQELIDYINQQLAAGETKETISNTLRNHGWETSAIKESFRSIQASDVSAAPENDSAQPSTPPGEQKPKSRASKLAIAIIFLIVAFVISGGVFAYFYTQQSPEEVVQAMIEQLATIQSLEYEGEMNISITSLTPSTMLGGVSMAEEPTPGVTMVEETTLSAPEQPEAIDLLVNFSGKSDISESGNPKTNFAFDIETDALDEIATNNSSIGVEIRRIGQVTYLKLNAIPNVLFFDLSALTNQWIEIDPASIRNQFGLEAPATTSPEQQTTTSSQIEELKQVYNLAQILKITNEFPNEQINDHKTHHYAFAIERDRLQEFVVDSSTLLEDKTLTEKEVEEMNEVLATIESMTGEIWIAKDSMLPYKISLKVTTKNDNPDVSDTLELTTVFSNYNMPVQIDAPASVTSIEEMVSELFGNFMGDVEFETVDASSTDQTAF